MKVSLERFKHIRNTLIKALNSMNSNDVILVGDEVQDILIYKDDGTIVKIEVEIDSVKESK